MIQSLHPHAGFLDELVASLAAKFHPDCIYLFGSRARGDQRDDSDYDIYMEVAPDNWPADSRHDPDGILWGYRNAEIHVRVPGWLGMNRDDPSRIMYDVAREGVLLYAAPGHARVVASNPPRRLRERPPAKSRRRAEWLRLGKLDFDLMLHLSADMEKWKEPLCFHAHQSAEKFLKALIASHRRPPRLHDLEALLEFARAFGYTLGGIDRRCRRLNPLATRGRYPPDEAPAFPLRTRLSSEDSVRDIEDARAIREAVELELP